MAQISLWAPFATSIELSAHGKQFEMFRGEDGHWTIDAPLKHGDNYAFKVDGEGPFPDPRSSWQPEGVDGPSKFFNHGEFQWKHPNWRGVAVEDSIIYELHIGTFTEEGTFQSAIDRLEHLQRLGITHVEVLPVNEFSGERGWGYDGVDLFAPHHAYGGPDGFKIFVDACHSRGIGVILDVVYNHLGPSGNYLEKYAPYFTDRYHTPWGKAVNLDGPYSYETRRFFCDNALMWLRDYKVDGLRLDAIHAFADESAVHFLEQLSREVKALARATKRPPFLIAESDLNNPRVVQSTEANGYGIDAQWSDDFHHAVHAWLTGESSGYYEDFGGLGAVAKAIKEVFVYDGCFSKHRKRAHGRPVGDLDRRKFLAYIQNHDQIGNRAQGERISQLVSQERLKIAATLVITSPFVPMLFQGEEWGSKGPFQYFTAHEDPDLAEAVRNGRRNEFKSFGWEPEDVPDPQAKETFWNSKLRWSELEGDAAQNMLNWHKQLIALRSKLDGEGDAIFVHFDEKNGWLEYIRGSYRIYCRIGIGEVFIPLPRETFEVQLSSYSEVHMQEWHLKMRGDGVVILKST
jgi:maltooligosyltrehalose trehalohydrolase